MRIPIHERFLDWALTRAPGDDAPGLVHLALLLFTVAVFLALCVVHFPLRLFLPKRWCP